MVQQYYGKKNINRIKILYFLFDKVTILIIISTFLRHGGGNLQPPAAVDPRVERSFAGGVIFPGVCSD